MSLTDYSVLASPSSLPGFWVFMYRVSPFTYLVEGMLTTGIANAAAQCAENEFSTLQPPSGQTCYNYLEPVLSASNAYLERDNATSDCRYCAIQSTNSFLANIASNPDNMWRNFGIMWAYIIFNVIAAVCLYWLVRVPKKGRKNK